MSTNHAPPHRGFTPRTLILAAALIAAGAAEAAWEAVPEIGMTVGTSDNVRLRSDAGETATHTSLNVQATLSSFSERGNFYVRPRIGSTSYSEDFLSELESTNYYLRTLGEYRWPRATIGFNTDYRNESIIDAEIVEVIPEDPDVPDPVDSETGRLVFLSETRERFIVDPYVDFNLSERSALRLGARYYDTGYSGIAGVDVGRTGFTETRFEAGIVRAVDERNNVTAQVFTSEYEAKDPNNRTDTVGVEGIFGRVLSETWNMNLRAGVQRSDYRIELIDETLDNADTNFAFDLGFRQRTERTTLNLNLRKIVTPSGTGYLVERDEISVYARRQTTERVSIYGGARLSSISAIDEASRTIERDYSRFDIGIEWAVARQMYLDFTYVHTFQEFAVERDSDARSNRFTIGFGYRGLSRQ